MKRQHAPELAIGIGVVAGLRPMSALALIAWGLRRGWIRPGHSPYTRIVSASASKRIAEFAISELIADKLPFTRSRLDVAPLTWRILSGAICGAIINTKRPPARGAVLGGLGALGGLPLDIIFVGDSIATCLISSLRSLRMQWPWEQELPSWYSNPAPSSSFSSLRN